MLPLIAPADPLVRPPVHIFKRREMLPLEANFLWQIQFGAVRLLTLSEDGTQITLGFCESGDLTGQPFLCIQPSEIECLTKVQAVLLSPEQCWNFQQVMRSHLHQMQELIRFRQGQIPQRLQQLLSWLALKFGHPIHQGRLIQLRLTHQDIADAIGTTRVTVTRLMQDLERSGEIGYSPKKCIIVYESLAK
ncbi:MAG: cAMP-binding protein [Phormidesmis priestleyi Ana]|uniref:cAMP-binding protein n=1 Tax=Phormidesmis priestleyi Ana TaxID=1666911 RepID=A0A0P7ZJD1_9CYAN|nr:MAG: cAMP-binding protein [Phormidesmis priestleyi Ana]